MLWFLAHTARIFFGIDVYNNTAMMDRVRASLAKGLHALQGSPSDLEEWARDDGLMHTSVYLAAVLGVLSVTRVCVCGRHASMENGRAYV